MNTKTMPFATKLLARSLFCIFLVVLSMSAKVEAATGKLSGTVTNDPGSGIANVYVSLYDVRDDWVCGTNTSQDGTYTAEGLLTGCQTVFSGGPSSGYHS